MTAEEFLQQYFITKQMHEHAWEDIWQRELRKFFGEYFLSLRSEADRNWATIPVIQDRFVETDDTVSFITRGEGHHTKRYYVSKTGSSWTIDRVMVQCDICEGTGQFDGASCELCGGRGWDDWLD